MDRNQGEGQPDRWESVMDHSTRMKQEKKSSIIAGRKQNIFNSCFHGELQLARALVIIDYSKEETV